MSIKEQLDQWIDIKSVRYSKDLDQFFKDHAIEDYQAGVNEMKELLLIAVKALEFECGNRCAIGINPCNARQTLAEIQEKIKGSE